MAFQRFARSASVRGGFGAGVGAALVMMLVMALLRFTTNTPSIPELMEESLVRLTGGQIESFFINALGVGGKALLLVTIVEGTLLLGGVLGLIYTHFWPASTRPGASPRSAVSGILYGLAVGLFLNAIFLPLVNQGFFGSTALTVTAPPDISQSLYGRSLAPIGLPVWLDMFLLTAIFGLTLVGLLPRRAAVAVTPASAVPLATTEAMPTAVNVNTGEPRTATRRDFTKALGGGAAAVVGGAVLWYGIREALAPPPVAGPELVESSQTPAPAATTITAATDPTKQAMPQPTEGATHTANSTPGADMAETPPTPPVPPGFENVKPLLVPEVTPVTSYYVTTKNFIDPTVDGGSWSLRFKGLADNPYSITFDDLKAMPAVDRIETLACISNPIGGDLIGNARWRGTNFAELVQRARPKAGVVDVIVRAADGYADSFPLEAALKNECVLVYEMNGKPLTQKHGYPARLLVPGIYGMKNCKWITEVEFVDNDFKGYWESQGWSDVAHYQTMSRIDYPNKQNLEARPLFVTGVAFAGDRGIKRVEVSTDGGKTWTDANLRTPLGKYTWTLWTFPWKPEAGSYTVMSRATDGMGAVQDAEERNTFPDGATGYHTRNVRVG